MNNVINLDEIKPERFFESHVENKDVIRHMFRGRQGPTFPGFDPKKLINWRHLEVRSHELNEIRATYSVEFWNTLKSLLKSGERHGANAVWVHINEENDHTLVYEQDGMTYKQTSSLIKDAIGRLDMKPVVVTGKDAAHIIELRKREEVFCKRCSVFRQAFKLSVQERLREIVKKMRMSEETSWQYYKPATFVIENCSRRHVVTSDERGMFTWVDGDFYTCR
jgi:hypothetical protein